MQIDILDEENFLDISLEKVINEDAQEILSYLKISDEAELSISIITDTEIRKLNKEYRNIDRATDILSFSQITDQNKSVLGDLVISYETALRHSKKYGIEIEKEFKKLLIHGILHLLGHDHKKRKEREIMRKKEKEISDLIYKNNK